MATPNLWGLTVLAPVGAVCYNALAHFVSVYTVNCLRYNRRGPNTFVCVALTVWVDRLCESGRLSRVNGQAVEVLDLNQATTYDVRHLGRRKFRSGIFGPEANVNAWSACLLHPRLCA